MEAGDAMYHASSGMVKHTRVVSSPLASNMAGIYGQPGPTHRPTLGASGHFLFNNRPAIIYFDSRLTPEVVTRSSPYGYVKEQPMEVGDTMYPPLQWYGESYQGCFISLASNMAGIMHLQHDDPKLAMPSPGSHMFSSQGDRSCTCFRVQGST